MHCSSKIYHHNNIGFTRECHCQNAIHLTFGNVSLLLSRAQLADLTTYIAETLAGKAGIEDREHKCIYLPTRDQYLMFVMSYNEISQLFEILENTNLMLEIEALLMKS